MAVLKHRKGRSTVQELIATPWRIVFITVHSLEHVPPVVLASGAPCRLKIDLLPCALSNIADQEIACHSIERKAPGVTHPICPDLVQRIRVPDERIVGWHCVIASGIAREIVAVDVYAEDFAQPDLEILGVFLRIASRTAVAQTGVEIAVRAKGNLATIVIRVRLMQLT